MKFLLVAIVLFMVAIATACGSQPGNATDTTPTPFRAEVGELLHGPGSERCFPPLERDIIEIQESLGDSGIAIRTPSWIRSADDPFIWFFAADIEGPAYEGVGPVAVWAGHGTNVVVPTIRRDSLFSLNEIAEQHSSIPTPTVRIDFAFEGAEAAKECVLQSLRFNPEARLAVDFYAPGDWIQNTAGDYFLVVSYNYNGNSCTVLPFESSESDAARIQVTGWPESAESPQSLSVEECNAMSLTEQHPGVLLETVPAIYQRTVSQATPVPDIPGVPTQNDISSTIEAAPTALAELNKTE